MILMMLFSCFIGEPCSVKLVHLILTDPIQNFILWNWYGLTETTVVSTFYPVNITTNMETIPIGRPFPNYHYNILDEFMQSVSIEQEGELLIGGVGIFAGYYGRDDLTEKALVEINGELFYRTGDLVRMDNNGIIYYIGRKDFQIKLHGQRIELGEIERCLLNTSISACVVIKWNEDHLVAYVQSSTMNEKELRHHCQSHLPSHMIPSMFVILEKLPLNANGKVDRKLLPPPDLSLLTLSLASDSNVPVNQLEQNVHDLWSQVLQAKGKEISTTVSFFSIGGHSLLFIELYHRYQSLFGFDTRELSITPFLQQPTIVQHAQLLQTININDMKSNEWHTLHINEGNIIS